MYQLGLCELQCFNLHGGNKNLGHYLLISTYKDFASNEDTSDTGSDTSEEEDENIFEEAQYYNESFYNEPYGELTTTMHPFIRNYSNIIKSPNYIKPEILSVILLSTGERVAIIKTVWIRIFQRTWRRKFAKRIAFFKNIHTIQLSRLNGRIYYRG